MLITLLKETRGKEQNKSLSLAHSGRDNVHETTCPLCSTCHFC